jgi:hypothetical protein
MLGAHYILAARTRSQLALLPLEDSRPIRREHCCFCSRCVGRLMYLTAIGLSRQLKAVGETRASFYQILWRI